MPPKMPLDRNAAMAIALSLLALACAGCGQKGSLYLPDRQPQAVPEAAPASTPAPADAPAAPKPDDAAPGRKPKAPTGG